MHDFVVEVTVLARGRKQPAQRSALFSGRTRLGKGEALAPLGCPIPAVA